MNDALDVFSLLNFLLAISAFAMLEKNFPLGYLAIT